jgi:uncharacterized protein (TIGR00255 family)
MIKSMTAFAKTEISENQLNVGVEIRTLNSRYLDYQIRVPHGYGPVEDKIKECVSRRIVRGRLEIRLFINDASEDACTYEVNIPKAKAYHQAVLSMGGALGLTSDIPITLFTGAQGLIAPSETSVDMDERWPVIERCIENCLAELDRMRQAEGDYLKKDFSDRLSYIESALSRIESESIDLVPQYQKKLAERIKSLTEGIVELDPARIAQEAAILADRSDITEEITRAKSHVIQFKAIMNGPEPGGRKLNFLLQEFNREFNTMGSKIGNAGISHLIVDVKSELERLREQVQNIE